MYVVIDINPESGFDIKYDSNVKSGRMMRLIIMENSVEEKR